MEGIQGGKYTNRHREGTRKTRANWVKQTNKSLFENTNLNILSSWSDITTWFRINTKLDHELLVVLGHLYFQKSDQGILMERINPTYKIRSQWKLPNTREINPTCASLSCIKTARISDYRTIFRKQTKISKIIRGIKSNCQAT